MANNLGYATIFQQELDKKFAQDSVTAWMARNAQLSQYNGGREIKIPKLDMDALADYSRSTGYTEGDVTLEYETRTMTRDRGRGFTLDNQDVNETNFVANAAAVMGEFQRTKVVPEVDAYNLSTVYSKVPTAQQETYTPAAASIFGKLKDEIAAVQDKVGTGVRLMIHITYAAQALLDRSTEFTRQVSLLELGGGLNTKVKGIDNNPLIPTPAALMYTAFNFWAGKADTSTGEAPAKVYTDKAAGGFEKKSDAKPIHWLIIPENAPIAVCKQDTVRTFTPETWQKANAWHCDYRRYFDLFVPDNKLEGLYACVGS